MKTLSQICTDAAQTLMVERGYTGVALRDAGAGGQEVTAFYDLLDCFAGWGLGEALDEAADELGWPVNDFRIFLLLNAAEALK